MYNVILAHVHVFYPELWPQLRACLGSLAPETYDLYVTTVQEYPDIFEDATALNPQAKCQVVKNLGYDVGPFIHVLNQVNLDDYAYVIKLHTKRDMPLGSRLGPFNMTGPVWRHWALSFIQPKANFDACIKGFEANSQLGMASYFRLNCKKDYGDSVATKECEALIQKMGLPQTSFIYVAGTMFMMRAHILAPLKALNLRIEDFPAPTREKPTTLAHTLERVFGALVYAQGFEIKDPFTPMNIQKRDTYVKIALNVWNFIYRKKLTRKGVKIIKLFKIPIYIK